jgi:hypothetical protein
LSALPTQPALDARARRDGLLRRLAIAAWLGVALKTNAAASTTALHRTQRATMWANKPLANADIAENFNHALTDEVAIHGVEVVSADHAKRRPQRQHR